MKCTEELCSTVHYFYGFDISGAKCISFIIQHPSYYLQKNYIKKAIVISLSEITTAFLYAYKY